MLDLPFPPGQSLTRSRIRPPEDGLPHQSSQGLPRLSHAQGADARPAHDPDGPLHPSPQADGAREGTVAHESPAFSTTAGGKSPARLVSRAVNSPGATNGPPPIVGSSRRPGAVGARTGSRMEDVIPATLIRSVLVRAD